MAYLKLTSTKCNNNFFKMLYDIKLRDLKKGW